MVGTPFITIRVGELVRPIVVRYRQHAASGKPGPFTVMWLGLAAGGKSTAAEVILPLLAAALGINPSEIVIVEDDNYLIGTATSAARGWGYDYDFPAMEENVMAPVAAGLLPVTFDLKHWETHEHLGTRTITSDVKIVLYVGRFPRKLVEEYAHYVVSTLCHQWDALLRGMWRSLKFNEYIDKSTRYKHLLYWITWSRKDREDRADEHTHDMADAVLLTPSRWFPVRTQVTDQYLAAA